MASLQRPSKDESRPSVSSSPAAPTARQHDSTSIGSRTPGSVASPLSGQRFEDLQRQGVIHHADALAQQAAAAAGGAVRRSIAVGPVMTAAHFASSNVDARGMGPEVMAAADLKSLSARQHGRGLEQGAQAAQQVSPNQLTGSFRMQAATMPYGAFAGYGPQMMAVQGGYANVPAQQWNYGMQQQQHLHAKVQAQQGQSQHGYQSPAQAAQAQAMAMHQAAANATFKAVPWAPNQTMPEIRSPSSSSAHLVSSSQALTATAKPTTLPPPPFFLANHLVHLACPLSALEGHVRSSLTSSQVDYEYSPAKWKAKCYKYCAGGYVYFVLRMFTHIGDNGGETYLVEMQRLRGCHIIFRGVYDKVLTELRSRGVVAAADQAVLSRLHGPVPACLTDPTGCIGNGSRSSSPLTGGNDDDNNNANADSDAEDDNSNAGRKRAESQESNPSGPGPASASAAAATGAASPAAPTQASQNGKSKQFTVPACLADTDLDPDDDLALQRARACAAEMRAGSGSGAGGGDESSNDQSPSSSENDAADNIELEAERERHGVTAFASLSHMLLSEYDDVCCPAAQSISAMSVSKRVRKAIGRTALVGLEAWRQWAISATQGTRALPQLPQSASAAAISVATPTPSADAAAASGSARSARSSGAGLSVCTAGAVTMPVPLSPPGCPNKGLTLPQNADGSIPVAQMLEHLVARACTPCFHPGMPHAMPRASIECRTACAIALANLSADDNCARALASLHAVPRLMYACFVVPHCAAAAAFRRETMRAVHSILGSESCSEARKASIPQMCLESARRMPGYKEGAVGDNQFDKWVASIVELLEKEVGNGNGSSQTSSRKNSAGNTAAAAGIPSKAAASLAGQQLQQQHHVQQKHNPAAASGFTSNDEEDIEAMIAGMQQVQQ